MNGANEDCGIIRLHLRTSYFFNGNVAVYYI